MTWENDIQEFFIDNFLSKCAKCGAIYISHILVNILRHSVLKGTQ